MWHNVSNGASQLGRDNSTMPFDRMKDQASGGGCNTTLVWGQLMVQDKAEDRGACNARAGGSVSLKKKQDIRDSISARSLGPMVVIHVS